MVSIGFPIDSLSYRLVSYGLALPQIGFPIDSLSYRFAVSRLEACHH